MSQPAAETDEKTVVSSRPPIPVPGQGDSMRRFELGQFHPGDRLDHFELVEFVGGGGMGRVFKARDLRLDRIVALKVIPRELASDSETLQRFLNEAKSAALLDHENIVRVFHIGEDNGMFFLVFEFVEGRTIRDLVQQRGRLPLTEAIHYAIQVADAVAHLAEAGVVHRDIKPSNILVDPHGRVKVIDLGLARIYHTAANDDLTATGVTLGTFDYISPEQARDPRSVDARSDIYSLGCTLFYMLSGRPPFPEGTVLQKLLKHQGDTPPDIREFRPELPEEISLLMRKMMAKDPNRRFRNATLLLEQLLVVAEHIGLRTDHYRVWAVPSRGEHSFLQRHLPWIVPTILLFAVGAGLSVFWAPSSLDDPPSGGPAVSGSPNSPRANQTSIPREYDATTPGESRAGIPSRANPTGMPAETLGTPDVTPGLPTPNGKENNGSTATRETDSTASGQSATADTKTMLITVAVDPIGPATPGVYRSVSEALRRAPKATTVELRFNGRAKETSWDISGRDVRILAAADYRPILSFAPESPTPTRSESLIHVRGGHLTLIDASLELLIPRSDAVERWTMIELSDRPEISIRGSSLTIRNAVDRGVPYHEDVAFFRAVEPEKRSGDRDVEAGPIASGEAVVDLSDVVVRGEATLLGGQQPGFGLAGLEQRPPRVEPARGLHARRSAALQRRRGQPRMVARHGDPRRGFVADDRLGRPFRSCSAKHNDDRLYPRHIDRADVDRADRRKRP